ncbi:MAG: dTMP kinase [Novosphingobium sp.]|nr:dTMP kinase [Novosphingobium sp.]
MGRGRFITFEGGEGAGKSTQAKLLAQNLADRGIAVCLTREPGGTPGAERIRSLLLETQGDGWNARAEALLFAAARSDHVERLIRPALEAGEWVICDRFIDSSRAYQGGAGGLTDADILALHGVGTGGLLPDLTLLIDVDPQEAQRRTKRRDGDRPDRIGGRPAGYHANVAAAFTRLAGQEPGRFARIDGNASLEDTQAAVLRAVDAMAGAA